MKLPQCHQMKPVLVAVVRVSLALGALLLVVLLSGVGGILNRSRGGWVDFSNLTGHYWPAHLVERLVFGVPTGFLVLVLGWHVRGGLVVGFLTWASLYVGWGSYMNVGTVNNYSSRTGVFDWLVGRQGECWNTSERFVREFTGMSLRGLVWTAPQGYLLQQLGFGWQYSLSGSLMGAVYYLGAKTPTPHASQAFFDEGTASSEVYWGWFTWFVLIVSCLTQLVRRIRIWVYVRNAYLGVRPFSKYENFKYESLNRRMIRFAYETFMGFLLFLFSCTVMYYSLVVQSDVRNKGQTFFGLFVCTFVFCFSLSWKWSKAWFRHKKKIKCMFKLSRVGSKTHSRGSLRRGGPSRTTVLGPPSSNTSTTATTNNPTPWFTTDNEHTHVTAGEGDNLLAWPHYHADRGPRQQAFSLPEGTPETLDEPPASESWEDVEHEDSRMVLVWPEIEKWIWLDIFVWTRWIIGFVCLIFTLLLCISACVAVYIGESNPRFMECTVECYVDDCTTSTV